MPFVELRLNTRNFSRLYAAIPDAVKQIVKKHKNVVLAGGSIRSSFEGTPANDFDIFFLTDKKSKDFEAVSDFFDLDGTADKHVNHAQMKEVRDWLVKMGFRVAFECVKGELITLKAGSVKIQLIYKEKWLSVQELLGSFDFTICQFATYDFSTLWTSTKAIKDVKKRRLSLFEMKYPLATLNRLHKYRKYGYKCNETCLLDICRGIATVMNSNPTEDQLALYVD